MKKVEDIISRINKIEIRTKELVSESFLGNYHSSFKGSGIEFSEVKDYQFGDDVRTIDWNVSARMNAPYIKKFVEERELSLNLVIDISKSMEYGSGTASKKETTAIIAGVLAFSALSNNDKVGLVLVSDRVESYLPPAKGPEQLFRILRDILFFEPYSSKSNISSGIDFLSSISHRKQIIFVLSDFSDFIPGKNWTISKKKHDIIPIIIEDTREHTHAPSGIIDIEDPETGELRTIVLSKHYKKWKEEYYKKQYSLLNEFRKIGQQFIIIDEQTDIIKALNKFFRSKGKI